MERDNEGYDGPQGCSEEAVSDSHGYNSEVRVDERESEDAMTDQGDNDGDKDEGDVTAHTVNHVTNDGCDEGRHQIHQT